jgi:hypothetical protein
MITEIETQAEVISLSGAEAGRAIWLAIDCAIEAGLSAKHARYMFDAMLETIVDEMSGTEAALFSASAYETLPMSATSTADRAKIDSDAWRAYEIYVGDAREAAAEDRADYYNDLARDERMMERA